MVDKLPIRLWIKPVISILREGKKTWSDLEKISIKLSESEEKLIPQKTLNRILKDYLEFWGLVRKEDSYWVWYENARVFRSSQEYDIAIEHSRKLLPALQNMLEIKAKDRHIFYSAAKEHLRSYPEIFQRLEVFEKEFNERVRELLEKYGKYIMMPDKFMMWDPVKVKGKGFLGKFFSQTEFIKRDIPYMIRLPQNEVKDFEEFEKTEEYRELDELRDFLDDTKRFNERFKIYGELTGDIAGLCLKIEMGQPLEGTCSLCPKIKLEKTMSHEGK
jgi:hypothetical protein